MCQRDTATDAGFSCRTDAGFSCRTDAGFSGRNGCGLLLPHGCGLSLPQWMRALPQRMRASPAARMRASIFFISCRSGCGFCRNGCGLHLPQRMRASPAATDAGFTCRNGCGLFLSQAGRSKVIKLEPDPRVTQLTRPKQYRVYSHYTLCEDTRLMTCEGFWSMHPVVPQRLALAAVRLTT